MRTRRKPASRPAAARARRAPVNREGWKLLVIDSAPIRKKARKGYEKVLRDIDTAKAASERFFNEDKPLYTKWLNTEFGSLLTEIRELREKVFQVEGLVGEVQREMYFGKHRSFASAYRRVLRRREEMNQEAASEEDAGSADKKTDQDKDPFRELFEEMFGALEDEFWEQNDDDFESEEISERPRPNPNGRVKELYRKLARRLHPDKLKQQSAKEIEWWYQAQDAYEEGNLEELEMISTLVEMEDNGAREATVSILSELTAEFKRSLTILKRQLRELKRDWAWNFSKRTDDYELRQLVRVSLENDRANIREVLKTYEDQIALWQAPERREKRSRSRQGSVQDELF